ncbi:MAG: response regulator [Pseudomonadota bacterium]
MELFQKKDQQILIVDDVPKNIQVIGTILRGKGFLCSIAQSGSQALEIVEQNPPDLILLDIMMDGMDGFETCSRLKKNSTTKDIPIIFLSGLSDTASKVEGFKIGAVDFITKPFQSEEVLVRIKTHLTLRTLQKHLEEKNTQLQEALDKIKTLKGLLPICATCKKVRDDKGYWNQIDVYIEKHSDALFSHGICPGCSKKMYGDQDWYKRKYGDS